MFYEAKSRKVTASELISMRTSRKHDLVTFSLYTPHPKEPKESMLED
jgi:hypothetical protein